MRLSEYVDAAELKRLLQGLVVFLGAILIFGLFAIIVVPGLRNANRPAAPQVVEPVSRESGWLNPAEVPSSKGYEKPPVDPKTLIGAGPALLARGKALFEKNCAQCHGLEGRGDGTASAGLNPAPRNFTRPDGWKNGPGLPSIYKTLTEGVAGSSMASFSFLSPTNRMALAHEVKALAAFPRGPEDAAALAQLSASLAKAAETVPAKIPVSLAMQKLEEEYVAPSPLAVPPEEERSPGAELFRRVVSDPARAARTLDRSLFWRNGIAELAAVAAPGAPSNGFAVSVATLGRDEWRTLLEELIRRMGWRSR